VLTLVVKVKSPWHQEKALKRIPAAGRGKGSSPGGEGKKERGIFIARDVLFLILGGRSSLFARGGIRGGKKKGNKLTNDASLPFTEGEKGRLDDGEGERSRKIRRGNVSRLRKKQIQWVKLYP